MCVTYPGCAHILCATDWSLHSAPLWEACTMHLRVLMFHVYLFVPPVLNPLIYSAKTKEICQAISACFITSNVTSTFTMGSDVYCVHRLSSVVRFILSSSWDQSPVALVSPSEILFMVRAFTKYMKKNDP
jgi:hypothetical protein